MRAKIDEEKQSGKGRKKKRRNVYLQRDNSEESE